MNGIVAAFGATGLYYTGFAIFKLAADRIEPLRANRLPRLLRAVLSNWIFLGGLVLVLGGLALQIVAMSRISLAIGVPIFMSGVVLLLLVALVCFGERLTGREWLSLLMIGGALLLITASIGKPPPITAADVPVWTLAVIVAPALIVPLVIQLLGDHRPDGRHARPITGIAYGVTSGISIGTAELCIKGWSDSGISTQSLFTPYPYATVAAATVGFGVMMAAFQRCRISIVAVVMTVSAKTHLLVTGSVLYGEPWPQDMRYFTMRLGALALGVIGVLSFPRHQPLPEPEPVPEHGPPVRGPTSTGQSTYGQRAQGQLPRGVVPFSAPPPPLPEPAPRPEPPPRPELPRHGLPAPRPPVDEPSVDGTPPFEDAPPGQSPFDRPPGQAPPGRRPPGRSPAGHLAPDRDGPAHPAPGPYAHDPLGRGPYRPDPWADDPPEAAEGQSRGTHHQS